MKVLASVLIAVGCLLAVPSAATAVIYTVNSTGDQPDETKGSDGCKTSLSTCTLRAAIEESNNSASTPDEIVFAASFNGQLADTITLGALFPVITDPVRIDGNGTSACEPIATIEGPCVGVNGPTGGFGLQVEADAVVIEGMSVTGALTGISVINASSEFTARANWIGVKLDGTAGANNTGIFLDPDSDLALIGSPAISGRNVIANNNNIGLDIQGADGALVRGNYFGVAPNGTTAAPNPINIEVTDSTAGGGFTAEENEIGGAIPLPEGATEACDGSCNVISGATSTGIDLNGHGAGQNEAPASGPTIVSGNYVGLAATGTAVVANATFGILSGASDDTTVGGPANGTANFIAGGGTGIYHENGEGFEAASNIIGSGLTGELTAPNLGMFVFCLSNANPVVVASNVIEMDGGTGIEQRFGGAEITTNFIEGGQYGILTFADPGAAGGNLIEGNVIGESVLSGIQIENDLNEVLGNAIYGSGGPGIRIQNQAALVISTGNLIGGDTPGDENTIRESGGDAIEIIDTSGALEDSQNEVARNKGDENGALFIDLVGNANDGIQPPTFATAVQSSASGGSALPGANVRVFRKETAETGELESFLGEAVADGSGNWKVTYPAAIPVGTSVAATQTSVAGGTSELAIATSAADPSSGGGSGGPVDAGGGKSKGEGKGKAKGHKADKKAPETTIVKGPRPRSRKRTVKFKFVSSEANSTFQCKLDRRPFKRCRSPKKYKGLKPGKHVFKVRAIDAAGNVDKTPAKRKFRVLGGD